MVDSERCTLLNFLACLAIVLALTQLGNSVEIEDLCACSATACNCLQGNITDILDQIIRPYCTTKLTRLVIANSKIPKLNDNAFSGTQCSELEALMIRYNQIERLSGGSFAGLSRMKKLDIGKNNLTTLDVPGIFSPFRSTLTTLKSASNQITRISMTTFAGLTALKTLDLEDNPIVTIGPDTFKTNSELVTLIISSNAPSTKLKMKALPPGLFKSLGKLRSLNITALGINSLQPNIFAGLDKLEILSLQGNHISNFSRESLSNLPSLQTLDLSGNRIHCLTASSFADLPKLTQLDISINRLTYITNSAFNSLSQLHILNLDRNPIAVIEPLALCSFRNIFLLRIDTLLGRVAFETTTDYAASAFAKLPNKTKIFGEGRSPLHGMEQSCDPTIPSTPLLPLTGSNITTPPENTENSRCPIATSADLDWRVGEKPNGSRKYLLIIVAICVTFLLVAFAVIMSYRAWSKRKMREQDAEDAAEKQEMLEPAVNDQVNDGANPAMNGGTKAIINHQDDNNPVPGTTTTASSTVQVNTQPSKEVKANGDRENHIKVDSSTSKATTDDSLPVQSPPDVVAQEENGATTITAFGVL